jgi:hypothetical protein
MSIENDYLISSIDDNIRIDSDISIHGNEKTNIFHERIDRVDSYTKDNKNTKNTKNNIYRYKFDETIINEIHNFSKIHEFDQRNDFKDAWNNWLIKNNLIVTLETQRLIDLGYQGDIIDKMFKSARYYFRKKSTEKKEPTKRRSYVGIQKELLDSMDSHILKNIKNNDYRPANGFDEFCKENLDLLKNEVNKLVSYDITDINEIKNKIKKTYKNRYFMIINK